MNYSKHVREEISDLEIGESKRIDLLGKHSSTFRMTLNRVRGSKRFITNTDVNGMFWIKREA